MGAPAIRRRGRAGPPALGLGKENFFLLGQSWGGILAIEYALKHQEHLRGLIVSNMMASVPAYNAYAKDVLMPRMDPDVLAEIQRHEAEGLTADPRYMELLVPHHYEHHVLRMPAAEWPEPVNRAFSHLNPNVYVPMQGPSELGASGKLVDWDRTADLASITVPTLVMGAKHDTMDPAHLEGMAKSFARGRYHHCPEGSHLAIYDDQASWFEGLLRFLRDVDSGSVLAGRSGGAARPAPRAVLPSATATATASARSAETSATTPLHPARAKTSPPSVPTALEPV